MMPLQDDDMLLIQRGTEHFKTTYGELKTQIATELNIPIPFVEEVLNEPT